MCPRCGGPHPRAECLDRRPARWGESDLDPAELSKLDRALYELALADRNDDAVAGEATVTASRAEWIKLDARKQACRLKYLHADRP